KMMYAGSVGQGMRRRGGWCAGVYGVDAVSVVCIFVFKRPARAFFVPGASFGNMNPIASQVK
ncbi:hypothetical protein ACWEQ8_43995, partial [Streptomyces noursei]